MGDFLWTFAVEEMLKKVLKVASDQIGLARGFEEHLSKLQKWLLKAEAFLCDINTRKLHHPSVRIWVDDLQHLVSQADELLDDIVYEHLRQKVQTSTMKKVRNFVSLSNNAFIFRRNMAKKMKTFIELLEKHYNEAAPLGLVGDESARPEIDVISQFRETISMMDDYEIVGRDVEVETIVKQVIDASNQQALSIMPIVGMGGLGKTTLAKLVFNHELIQNHFDKTIWVCVSEPFIVNKILRAILQNLRPTSISGDNREVLLRELQKEVLGKRYFLVLDDVWNEDTRLWDELKNCLPRISENSENCIVVTTRNAEVAKIVGTHHSHHLSRLSDDQCWSVFKESANASRLSMTSNLELHRKELVKRIGGIPLVARVFGKAVRFEGDDERREKMLQSVLTIQQSEENFALSILKLSVDRLPSSSLKQCFAYCSNFPKDFEFERRELVQMWMAQGYTELRDERNKATVEDVGDVYFDILLSQGLFQESCKDDGGRITKCKMHDLIHDIAGEISSDLNLKLIPSNMLEKELREKESKVVASKLRTIDFARKIPHNIDQKVFDLKIENFVCLRVLKMHLFSTDELQLLNSIGQLKGLRYLEISSDFELMKLPKSIGLLYHLQTLKIMFLETKELPKNLTNLVSLRHVEFSENVEKMPPCLSKLTRLQTLSNFVAAFEKDGKITELGPLKNLQGSLRICCLEKVESKEEACRADLGNKEKLDKLEFVWSSLERKEKYRYNNDMEVLEMLKPHKNLKSLVIRKFANNVLPNNAFFENLKEIELDSCEYCERLPILGELNNLKHLSVDRLSSIRSIGSEFYGNDLNQRTTLFPKLVVLAFRDMMNLEEWESSNVTTFPKLKWLEIVRCPKLLNIPDVFGYCDENDVQHLITLNISHCSKLTKLPNGLHFCRSIQNLMIYNCSNLSITFGNKLRLSHLSIGPLEKFPEEELGQLIHLQEIDMAGCMHDYDFSFLCHHISSLKSLALREELSSVIQLPHQLQFLTALQYLRLDNFDGIEALPEWFANFQSLILLNLSGCQNLKQLPSKQAILRLTKLSYLSVWKCPNLQLCQGDTERAKLSHVRNICVYDSDLSFFN